MEEQVFEPFRHKNHHNSYTIVLLCGSSTDRSPADNSTEILLIVIAKIAQMWYLYAADPLIKYMIQ